MGMDTKIEKKKGIRPKHILYFAIGISLILLLIKLVNSAGTSVYRVDKDKITVSSIIKGDFKDYISIIGTVEPISTIYLDVEEGGKVTEKVIDEGEIVHTGDVIVKLANNDLNLQILNTESQLAYQSNELRNTMIGMEQQKISNKQQLLTIDYAIIRLKRNYAQNETLFEKGFISKEDFMVSKEAFELALKDRELKYERMVQDSIFRENQKVQMDNSLKNMEQNLSMVRQRLENLNIKAPANGQLGTLDVEVGQSIGKGKRIGQLHILDNFKVVATVDEHYIDRVRKHLPASFDRQEKEYKLVTKKVYPEVRDGQFEVDLIFDGNTPQQLRTGQTYHLKLELGQPVEAILIPRGAFFQSTGGNWVFVLDKNEERATKRNIKIGKQNPLFYEVLEGLEPEDQVITSSYDTFGDNDVIEFK